MCIFCVCLVLETSQKCTIISLPNATRLEICSHVYGGGGAEGAVSVCVCVSFTILTDSGGSLGGEGGGRHQRT